MSITQADTIINMYRGEYPPNIMWFSPLIAFTITEKTSFNRGKDE